MNLVRVDAEFVLSKAANLASSYDRNASGEVLLNRTASFHLCGLIERAASLPKSGATHRRAMDSGLAQDAKAAFCLAHRVAHPASWEFEAKRSWQEVQSALLVASVAAKAWS